MITKKCNLKASRKNAKWYTTYIINSLYHLNCIYKFFYRDGVSFVSNDNNIQFIVVHRSFVVIIDGRKFSINRQLTFPINKTCDTHRNAHAHMTINFKLKHLFAQINFCIRLIFKIIWTEIKTKQDYIKIYCHRNLFRYLFSKFWQIIQLKQEILTNEKIYQHVSLAWMDKLAHLLGTTCTSIFNKTWGR